jgi:predicted MFS family arabinose efflux permease
VPDRLGSAYARLWSATTISNLGDGITLAAAPLLAAQLTDDPRLVAGLAVAQRLPWLLFALVAGALVDRWDRRTVMARANVFRAAALGVVAVTAATDTIGLPVLYVVFFGVGVAETFFDNAAQAFMPGLVEPAQLPSANSRMYAGEIVANQFAGPPLGGIAFGVAVALPFALDGATFAAAAVLIASLPRQPRPRPVDAPPRSLRTDIGEGLRYLFAHPLLRPMALVLGLMNLLATMTLATLVLLARDRLGLSEAGYGVLLISGAVGGLLATPFAPRLTARLGEGGVMIAAMWGLALTPLLVPLTHSPWIVGLSFALEAAFGITWNVATVSLRQRIIPDRLFGRVNSVYRLLAWGTMPIGAAIGGVVVDRFGLVAPYWVAVVVMVVAATWFSTRLGNRHVDAAKRAAGVS